MPNKKISELDELTTVTNDDLLVIVNDPGGDPTSYHITIGTLFQAINDYGITSATVTSTSGAVTFDYSLGNAFEHTLDENVTSITLSNPPASGTYGEIIIKFVQDSTGSWTVAGWPASVKWIGGTEPTITTTATTGTDIIALKTWDGGTTWYGDYSQDYS